jgi:hypothetical protein
VCFYAGATHLSSRSLADLLPAIKIDEIARFVECTHRPHVRLIIAARDFDIEIGEKSRERETKSVIILILLKKPKPLFRVLWKLI